MKKEHYERKGIFVNVNHETDKVLLDALDEYVAEHCIKYASAMKSLAMKALIAEGRIVRPKISKARN